MYLKTTGCGPHKVPLTCIFQKGRLQSLFEAKYGLTGQQFLQLVTTRNVVTKLERFS